MAEDRYEVMKKRIAAAHEEEKAEDVEEAFKKKWGTT